MTTLSVDALAEIRTFLQSFGARVGWRDEAVERVQLAAEEALVSLMGDEGEESDAARRLRLSVRSQHGAVELEFLAVAGEGNLEDRLALAGEQSFRGSGRARLFTAAVASPGCFCQAPEVPRHGHSDGEGGFAGGRRRASRNRKHNALI